MRCVSCGADIPPQWVSAIKNNVCPGCDGVIMSDDSKTLMDELQMAISQMPSDPQGLAGWILSNYRIKKIGEAEPIERFHRKGGQLSSDEQIKVASPELEKFLNRTGMSSTINNTKQAVQQQKNQNNKYQHLTAAIEDIDPYDSVDDNVEEPDQEDVEFIKQLKSQGINPFAPGPSVSAKKGVVTPDNIQNVLNSGSGSSNIGLNNDVDDFSEEEQKILSNGGKDGQKLVLETRLKRIKAQNAVLNGNIGGAFRR